MEEFYDELVNEYCCLQLERKNLQREVDKLETKIDLITRELDRLLIILEKYGNHTYEGFKCNSNTKVD